MMRIIAVYGTIAGLAVAVLMQIGMRLMPEGGIAGMVVGYLNMLISLSLVFVGVRQYRDTVLGGVIRFWPAFGVGAAIALVASFFYVAAWEIYLFATDYRFIGEYAAKALETMAKEGKPAAEIAKAAAEWDDLKAQYANPAIRFLFTFSEIAPVALLVPLVSALILRNPRVLPATA